MRINTMLNSSALRVRNRLRRKTPGTNTFCATRANAFSADFACVYARRSWESAQSVLPAEASQLLYRRNSINRSGIHSVSHADSAYLSARRAHLLKSSIQKECSAPRNLHRDALHRLRRKMRDKCFSNGNSITRCEPANGNIICTYGKFGLSKLANVGRLKVCKSGEETISLERAAEIISEKTAYFSPAEIAVTVCENMTDNELEKPQNSAKSSAALLLTWAILTEISAQITAKDLKNLRHGFLYRCKP